MYDPIYIGKRLKEADDSPRDQRAVVYLEVIAKLLSNFIELKEKEYCVTQKVDKNKVDKNIERQAQYG